MQVLRRLAKHLIVALCAFNLGLASDWLMTAERQEPLPESRTEHLQYFSPIPTVRRCAPIDPKSGKLPGYLERLAGIERKILDIEADLRELSAKAGVTDAEIFLNLERNGDLTIELYGRITERSELLDRLPGPDGVKLVYRELCF